MRDYEAEGRARFRAYVVENYMPSDMNMTAKEQRMWEADIDKRLQAAYDHTLLGAQFKLAAAVDITVAEFKRQMRRIFLRKVS